MKGADFEAAPATQDPIISYYGKLLPWFLQKWSYGALQTILHNIIITCLLGQQKSQNFCEPLAVAIAKRDWHTPSRYHIISHYKSEAERHR